MAGLMVKFCDTYFHRIDRYLYLYIIFLKWDKTYSICKDLLNRMQYMYYLKNVYISYIYYVQCTCKFGLALPLIYTVY